MRTSASRAAVVALGIVTALPVRAAANPEPSLYDARSVGMAGSGVAWLDGAAALYHNPANLQGVANLDVTVALATILADLQAPIAGPDDKARTGINVAPTALIGGAVRVHDRVVVGLGAYFQTGFGASFDNIQVLYETDLGYPQDQSVFLAIGEVALPVSVRLHDRLDVGVALRLPYGKLNANVTQEILPGNYKPVEQTVSGFGQPGVLAGVTFRATRNLTVGASYRSKVRIDMNGTTAISFTQADPLEIDTDTTWYVPHMARLGAALKIPERRLMVTAEGRVQFHREANKEQTFYTDLDGFEETTAPFEWRNVLGIMLAAEYVTVAGRPFRFGVSASNSATPKRAVQFFTPPPGLLAAIYFGTGIRRTSYDVDFGVSLNGGREDVPPQAGRCEQGQRVKVGCAGQYGVISGFLTASISFAR